jgi:hypothetical protein
MALTLSRIIPLLLLITEHHPPTVPPWEMCLIEREWLGERRKKKKVNIN